MVPYVNKTNQGYNELQEQVKKFDSTNCQLLKTINETHCEWTVHDPWLEQTVTFVSACPETRHRWHTCWINARGIVHIDWDLAKKRDAQHQNITSAALFVALVLVSIIFSSIFVVHVAVDFLFSWR